LRSVRQDPQDGKQIGNPLDLIDDDQSTQRLQGQQGIGEPGLILRVLQIEILDAPRLNLCQAAGQSGFPDLSRADKAHHPMPPQQRP